MESVHAEDLNRTIGGAGKREKFVSAFYCEYCGKTIHLNMIYSLDRAKKEHNAKYHPQIPNIGTAGGSKP
ncbi:MAG: hypothetical protein IKS55_11595 [Oscillospiraceae bacterium]|nr:hypothetical protein [Oscillospiraceae bacterium]